MTPHNPECCCGSCLTGIALTSVLQPRTPEPLGTAILYPPSSSTNASRDVGIVPGLDRVLAEIRATMRDRHEKYGPRNIADSPGGPLNGVRVRVHDKLARINNHVDNNTDPDFADDALRDAFVDLAGYALIGLLVVDGEWPVG